jgi:hypothetical protein
LVAATGVKSAEMMQLALTGREAPQGVALVVRAKSDGLAPPSVMPLMLSAVLPVLVSVMVCDALATLGAEAKLRVVAVRLATGPTATPVPVTAAVCGEPAALSVTAIDAARVPGAVGVKVT